jgi:hypothetical protein
LLGDDLLGLNFQGYRKLVIRIFNRNILFIFRLTGQQLLMNLNSNTATKRSVLKNYCRVMTRVGNALTLIGGLSLLLGMLGVFDMQIFSLGLSSGVRIIGTVAIAGCLLSAIGYGISDYSNK